jgi:restriction system-associated AAA family ATPase
VAAKPYVPYSNNREKKEIYFEIDYKIKVASIDYYVRIKRPLKSNNPTFLLFTDQAYNTLLKTIDYNAECRKFIPIVIAYTSGLNDLLSMPFIELQDYYAREVTHQVKVSKDLRTQIPEPNMMLLDYDSNAAIIIANYLLNNDTKLSIFNDFARIKNLNSFKIVIQLNKTFGNNKVLLPEEFENIIKDLQKCSTLCVYNKNDLKGDTYEMDFLVNSVTKELFKHYFGTPKKLFTALSKLNLLNTLCLQSSHREELRGKRKEGKLLRFPTIATLDKIFRIEEIELILSDPIVRTEYMKISDGEHQFLHIVGGILLFDEEESDKEVLYLLDEPDTHFNPQWRSDFFNELDEVTINKNHEIILTTHSPFILGDCHGYNVFVFERDRDNNSVNFKRSNYETFGTNFSFLLKNIFGFDHQMSNKSKKHLLKLETDIGLKEKQKIISKAEIDVLDTELKLYGESVEKLFLINKLGELKNKLTENKN